MAKQFNETDSNIEENFLNIDKMKYIDKNLEALLEHSLDFEQKFPEEKIKENYFVCIKL